MTIEKLQKDLPSSTARNEDAINLENSEEEEEENFTDLEKYFTKEEFSNMDTYEKRLCLKQLQSYHKIQEQGRNHPNFNANVGLPFFMKTPRNVKSAKGRKQKEKDSEANNRGRTATATRASSRLAVRVAIAPPATASDTGNERPPTDLNLSEPRSFDTSETFSISEQDPQSRAVSPSLAREPLPTLQDSQPRHLNLPSQDNAPVLADSNNQSPHLANRNLHLANRNLETEPGSSLAEDPQSRAVSPSLAREPLPTLQGSHPRRLNLPSQDNAPVSADSINQSMLLANRNSETDRSSFLAEENRVQVRPQSVSLPQRQPLSSLQINQAVNVHREDPVNILELYPNFESLKPELPKYDIIAILESDLKAKTILPKLLENGIVYDKDRKKIVQALVHSMYKDVKTANQVTTQMREGMAKSIVRAFPRFYCHDYSTPWGHFYCSESNTGYIANVAKRTKAALGLPKQRASKKMKTTPRLDPTSNPPLSAAEVRSLAVMLATRSEKNTILDQMQQCFSQRNEERRNGISITEMIEKYPHLISYQGEVLMEEYRQLYPQSSDFCSKYFELQHRILSLQTTRPQVNCFLEEMQALLLLAKSLPHDIAPRRDWHLEELLLVCVDIGTDLPRFVEQKRNASQQPVQPYLLALQNKTVSPHSIIKYFLVLDSHLVELGRVPAIKAFEWLIKSYFIFNVNFPLGWRNCLKFIQHYFFKIREGPRDNPSPSASELFAKLTRPL